jgi:S1-C subfamily serine protease
MRVVNNLFASAALIVVITGCTVKAPEVPDQPIIPIADPAAARPVQFHRIAIGIDRGTDIGLLGDGIGFCERWRRWIYRPGEVSFSDDDLTKTFRTELTAANYNVVGDPDALFDDPSAWKAEYLVAGSVKRINSELCYFYDRYVADTKVYGFVVMDVHWQIYSRLDRKVVHQTSTQGRGVVSDPSVTSDPDVFLDAFAQATRNLLGDRGFHDLIAGTAPGMTTAASAALPATALRETVVPNRALFGDPVQRNMRLVRANVVTVRSAEGHGSGFYIDGAGHILTNEHVAGGGQRVKVILESGQEIDGMVVAADPQRDVALIKATPGGQRGLPLRRERPEIGAEVYAIGSPILEELSGTVSKGIVSAYRRFDGLEFIQSDVTTVGGSSGGPLLDDRGNVVGMAVSGFEAADVPMGINLFIPIGDALRSLGIGSAGES